MVDTTGHRLVEFILREPGQIAVGLHIMNEDGEVIGAELMNHLPEELLHKFKEDMDTHLFLEALQATAARVIEQMLDTLDVPANELQ
jgi:hypothetical protein